MGENLKKSPSMYQRRMVQIKNLTKQKGGETNSNIDSISNMSGHRSCNEFTLRMRLMASLQQSEQVPANVQKDFSDNEIP